MEDAETLNLSHKNLLKMPVIDTNIKNVILYRNKIDKITTLPSHIEYLDISDNVIERIENLENLNSLKVLDMSFNLLESIENLEHLVNLEELYLHANEIKKIENLDCLKNLKKLDLSSNDITKIENLMDLTSLQELYIANNEITEMPDLSFLCNLKVLGMQNNLLKSLDCHNLPNGLETLLLNENNELETIENFDHLTSLSYVEFIKTKVKNIDTNSKAMIVYKQNGIDE